MMPTDRTADTPTVPSTIFVALLMFRRGMAWCIKASVRDGGDAGEPAGPGPSVAVAGGRHRSGQSASADAPTPDSRATRFHASLW